MSFTKTVSTVAALTTIFGASVAAWRLVEYQQTQQNNPTLEQKVLQLEKELKEAQKLQVLPQVVTNTPTQVSPPALSLPPSPPPPVHSDQKP